MNLLTCLAFALLLGCAHTSPSPAAAPAATIDLDVRDAPLEDVLRMIASEAHINLALDGDVSRTVTLRVHARPYQEVLDTLAKSYNLRVDRVETPGNKHFLRVSNVSSAASPSSFSGTPVSIDFADTPIRDVVAMLSDRAKVTIGVDEDVQVAVTLRLHDVPWDLVLDHIARKYELRVVHSGSEIRLSARR